jgi:hypothetical protein
MCASRQPHNGEGVVSCSAGKVIITECSAWEHSARNTHAMLRLPHKPCQLCSNNYASPAPVQGRTHTCRMVGLPWGQFQGAVSPASLSRMPRITLLSRAVPIMIEERQAREASIARTLQVICIIIRRSVTTFMQGKCQHAAHPANTCHTRRVPTLYLASSKHVKACW